ncbi:MAG: hypothetical protein KC502_17990 [Myxococcales bacterium]|nr:hypothetical protein [Myxococcales bacterium]
MHQRITMKLGLVVVASLLAASQALAAAPNTSLLEGMMTSSGGGAAADGTYDVTFTLWGAQSGGTAVWSEGPVKVAVKGGQFSYGLGTTKALDMKKVAALSSQWIGMKIGSDPALPRQRVHGALFALYAKSADSLTCTGCLSATHIANGSVSAAKMGFNYAGSATKGGPASDLNCTGCVSVKEMKFDADVNLGANSLKAKNGTFAGDLAAGTVTATSFAGDGSKLTGIKIPTGECKTAGEVVKGINADGSLKCVKALDPNNLPADGLNEISNNMLTNQFVYTESAKVKKQPIPDNTGSTADSIIAFPNIGTAQTLDVKVTLENSNLAAVSMQLLPPDDKKVGYVLCDPCGKKDQRKLTVTYNAKNPPQKQAGAGKKIGDWVGGNPQGAWTLKVLDVAFCVVQIAENKPLCPIGKGVDGWISDWSINMQYISNKKIGLNGNQEISGNQNVAGDLVVGGSLTVAKPWTYYFPKGSRPILYGYHEDHLNGSHMHDYRYDRAYQVPVDSRDSHRAVRHIMWADYAGNIRKMHGGDNYGNGSNDQSMAYMMVFVKNTSAKDITHKVCFYYSSRGTYSNHGGIAINGPEKKADVWVHGGNTLGSTCQNVVFPKSRSSAVTLKMGTYEWTPWNGYWGRCVIGFYNNTWILPAGLEWDYERYWKWMSGKD